MTSFAVLTNLARAGLNFFFAQRRKARKEKYLLFFIKELKNMSKVRSSLFLFCARVFNAGSQFVLVIVVSRALGPEEFGLFSFLSATVLIGYTLGNFGLDTYMVREISKGNILIKDSIGHFFLLKVCMAFITIFLFAVFFILYPLNQKTSFLFMVYSLSILFRVPAETLWYAGDGCGRFEIHSILWLMNNLLKMVSGVCAIFGGGGIDKLIYALVAADAIALAVSWFIFSKTIGPFSLWFDLKSMVEILRKVWLIALGGFLGVFYFRLDTLMLEAMKGNLIVGFYSAAYRVFEIFSIFPGTMLLVFFPLLSRSHGKGQEVFQKHFSQGIFILGFTGFFAGCLVYYFSPWVIHTMYGEAYGYSVSVLRILAGVIFFYFINFHFGLALVSMGKERQNLFFLLFSTFLNFVLNLIMIPSYEHIGAAWATMFSEIFLLSLYLYNRKKLFGIIN